MSNETSSVATSAPSNNPMKKIIAIVAFAIVIFLVFIAFSVTKSVQNNDRLADIEALYFPVLERTDANVVRLPAETQAMMQLAACIGSQFSLDMLAQIAGKPTSVVIRCLWPALRDGLLVPEGGDWFLGMVSPHCRFLHDRMLQAAYQSMSEVERQQTHLRVVWAVH
ncbi:MAG: hypothetical protein IPM37_22320 [Hahellaceae bacterium]|nr:hypothetical protein [Hahellaceae bacterium]